MKNTYFHAPLLYTQFPWYIPSLRVISTTYLAVLFNLFSLFVYAVYTSVT